MRFLHTADWQMGMRAVHVGTVADEVRAARFAAAKRVVDLARRHDADFILIAGDTFEDNGVDPVDVRRVIDLLAGARRPVFLLPGNHDPLEPGSVYDHPAWSEAAGLTILREAAPVAIPGGTLFPCPARERQGGVDPTSWIPSDAGPGDGIRIGVAHGTVEGIRTEEPDFPIGRDAATRARLDYLALGHWHSTGTFADAAGAVRMAYAGTHEPTRFGERDSGNVLLVEIAGPGAQPSLSTLRTGGLAWLQIEREVRGEVDLESLRAELSAVEEPGRALVDLRLRGVLGSAGADAMTALEETLAARFLYHRIDARSLDRFPAGDAWLENLPAGVLREAAARLKLLGDPAYAGPRPEGASAEVAGRALVELYALSRTQEGES